MEQWFDNSTAGMFGGFIGSFFGIIGALIGCLSGICVRKGLKKPIYGIFIAAICLSVVLLVTAAIAFFTKQPYHVWYSFALPGIIGTVLFPCLLPVIRKRFTQSELLKMQAKDI